VKRRVTSRLMDKFIGKMSRHLKNNVTRGYSYTHVFFLQIDHETEVKHIKNMKGKSTELVNDAIPHNVELLVIDDQGNKLGIMSRKDALNASFFKDLDLVVVSPDSKPMVAKMMDYSKYRYDQQRKLREMKKNQQTVELKEIRLSPTIDKHDFETKLRHALRFLEKGHKVKLSIRFFGRMITHIDVGRTMMEKFIEGIGSSGNIELRRKMDGRHLIAIIAPINT
jgi:translation initiation factor IF-3